MMELLGEEVRVTTDLDLIAVLILYAVEVNRDAPCLHQDTIRVLLEALFAHAPFSDI